MMMNVLQMQIFEGIDTSWIRMARQEKEGGEGVGYLPPSPGHPDCLLDREKTRFLRWKTLQKLRNRFFRAR